MNGNWSLIANCPPIILLVSLLRMASERKVRQEESSDFQQADLLVPARMASNIAKDFILKLNVLL